MSVRAVYVVHDIVHDRGGGRSVNLLLYVTFAQK